jgi:hypothetical protein
MSLQATWGEGGSGRGSTQLDLEVVRQLPALVQLALQYGKVMLLFHQQALLVVNDLNMQKRRKKGKGKW